MRRALRASKMRGARVERVVTIPAPTAGWNAKDTISAMGAKDALTLENFVVTPSGLAIRPGRTTHATGVGSGAVESLMEWASPSGTTRFFAASPTDIYDVSVAGAAGAAVQSSLTNGRWQHVNFSTAGGNYLFCVNGQDAPRHYNGTAWNQPVITGIGTPANLIAVMVHMNRLWFIEKGTRKVWYLPVQAIAGTATAFDMSSLFTLGGELAFMATWTRDGGSGSDDYAVFGTTKGEVLIYAGVDPAANTTWALVGRFYIPPPIGRRCTLRLGAELIVLTSQGPIPLSQSLPMPLTGQANTAITDRISGAFEEAFRAGSAAFGWQLIEHPKRSLVLANIPRLERVMQDQFVFGTRTGAWSRWTGINAGCLGLFGTDLYAGGNDGRVYKLDGLSDDGQPIQATYQHAFSALGSAGLKRALRARARLIAPPGYVPAIHVRTDFDTSLANLRTVAAIDDGPLWDVTDWDTAYWGAESVATQAWQGVEGVGSTVSVLYRIASTARVLLNGTDLSLEAGGTL